MDSDFKNYLLTISQAAACEETEVIQSLWSGYGKILRYRLSGSEHKTVVVKHIHLGHSNNHPRGWNTDTSHQRKVKSYEVESCWYREWSQQCTSECKVPLFLGSYSKESNQWIVLEDLDLDFPLRKQHLSLPEAKTCLKWLANFHGTFLNQKPIGLWEVGSYWHLKTRLDELEKMEDSTLKAKAQLLDEMLIQCKYQTIIHGDAKVANFCFSQDASSVAAVDFQYAGGGCGMKDVAYFLGSCLTSSECEAYEKELLDYYFQELKFVTKQNIDFKSLEKEWRTLYSVACADFVRFLLGWMPTHQKINDYNLKKVKSVLSRLS